ncbi:unnamed protein product, partial [Chrysoparadoxa australica]
MNTNEPDKPIEALLNSLPQEGLLVWIGLRPKRKVPLESIEKVEVDEIKGLSGDHFSSTYSNKRQITLIQQEHLETVASILERERIDPEQTRRNLVIRKINLLALVNQQVSIGEVILEGTGHCHPCSRM